ncbi:MAG: hypothetical protein ACE5PV_25405, partial [Candidatus Poribacteria bacterium]
MEDFAVASKLKEKLGEYVVEDLDKWMREIVQSKTKDQYTQILSRLDLLEDRYEGIKDEVYRLRGEMNGFRTEVNQRFDAMNDSINQRLDAMNNSINQRFDVMNERILSSIKWSVGTIATFG